MTLSVCRTGAVLCFVVAACSQGASSSRERRELIAMDGAIAAWTNAMPEDRAIRLRELESMEVKSERVKEVLNLCVGAFRAFLRSNELLEKARSRTLEVESAVAELRSRRDAGAEVDAGRGRDLTALGNGARVAIDELNQTLNQAEEMVSSCDERRKDLRKQIDKI